MKSTEDEDEVFTFRRPEVQTPSSRLEEIVSAATLKFAKERFLSRDVTESTHQGDDSTVKAEPLSSGNESQPSEAGDDGEDDERMDIDQESEGRQQGKQKASVKTFKPVVATDDDVSYALIRPSTRRILETLDNTLFILHNARMTSAQYLEDSEESSSENEDGRDDHEMPQRMSQSRQSFQPASSPGRSPSKPPRMPTGDEAEGSAKKKSNRGRPRKYVPREGESERDFEIRRARALKGKVRIPTTTGDEDDVEATTTAGESQSSPRKRASPHKRRRKTTTDDREYWMQKKLDRFKLRDWSDVMGAAALAGFPPSVVARATQRCADLFGQGMEMHRIDDTAVSSGASGVKTTTYQPRGQMPSTSPEAEEGVGGLGRRQARSMSRLSSAAPSRTGSPTSDEEGDEEEASPKKSQKRATSRDKGQHYCPFPDCERATAVFDRPFNLKRHMKLVHGQDSPEAVEENEAEADEMLDGIRRDGFLKPIHVQRGWRAEDTKKRAKKNS